MAKSTQPSPSRPKTHVIVPALNEQDSIASVVQQALAAGVDSVTVVDNGSTDQTATRAHQAGARVVRETVRGYGSACQRGIDSLSEEPTDSIILFLDGDGADDPDDIRALIEPLHRDDADLVIGSRTLGDTEPGALSPPQRMGNWLATRLLALCYNVRATDLGPMRALSIATLRQLDMRDRGFGWTMEMQVRAAVRSIRVIEIPVGYRKRRHGRSKISGSMVGSVRAGLTILWTLASAGRRR